MRCSAGLTQLAPESQTFTVPVEQARPVRDCTEAAGMTADRRRLWGFLARRAGAVVLGYTGAPEAAVRLPVLPDQAGSPGTAGAGPTGRR